MAKKTYVGVLSDVPVYETTSVQAEYSMENYDTHFFTRTVNSGVISNLILSWSDTDGVCFRPNSSASGAEVAFTLTARHDLTGVQLRYRSVSGSSRLTIKIKGVTQKISTSSTSSVITVGALNQGETIYLKLTQGATNANPYVYVMCDDLNGEQKVITGYEQKEAAQQITKMYCSPSGVARAVKKAYVGDENGIARQFFEGSE